MKNAPSPEYFAHFPKHAAKIFKSFEKTKFGSLGHWVIGSSKFSVNFFLHLALFRAFVAFFSVKI
jgi:hypothetical protein